MHIWLASERLKRILILLFSDEKITVLCESPGTQVGLISPTPRGPAGAQPGRAPGPS